jgi:hypothetical protein
MSDNVGSSTFFILTYDLHLPILVCVNIPILAFATASCGVMFV